MDGFKRVSVNRIDHPLEKSEALGQNSDAAADDDTVPPFNKTRCDRLLCSVAKRYGEMLSLSAARLHGYQFPSIPPQ